MKRFLCEKSTTIIKHIYLWSKENPLAFCPHSIQVHFNVDHFMDSIRDPRKKDLLTHDHNAINIWAFLDKTF